MLGLHLQLLLQADYQMSFRECGAQGQSLLHTSLRGDLDRRCGQTLVEQQLCMLMTWNGFKPSREDYKQVERHS